MLHTPALLGVTVTDPNLSLAAPVTVVLQAPNVAVTAAAALSDATVQVPIPEQPEPLQPPNVPLVAVAVKVTDDPAAKLAEQVTPQLMPEGELLTVPVPVPTLVTVMGYVTAGGAKVAVTLWVPVIVMTHGAAVQPPLQPVKVDPAVGLALSVTAVPGANTNEQVAPQSIPAGELLTVPVPAPARDTVNEDAAAVSNVAVTAVTALIVTVQSPVPVHGPLVQPVNDDPAVGEAASVTTVPDA